ncbi:MAG: hypothetical protein V4723_02250 [Pseudomonadota bacterium]
MQRLLGFALAVLAASACPGATAQTPAYDSAFAGYKSYEEPKLASWKETNDKIGATPGHGGHAGHDMSAMKQAPKAPAPPAKPAVPAVPVKAPADPHAGHKN